MNRVAVVTGANKGIGLEIARQLGREGIAVWLGARDEARGRTAVEKLRGEGLDAHALRLDVTDDASVAAAVARLEQDAGRLDILVNNAGIAVDDGPPSKVSLAALERTYETNVFGVFYCCHEAIPLMKKRGGGYIINISSLAGANPHAEMAAYNASKFGLNGFSEALMQEVRHDRIKVTYIMPGSVNTAFGGDEPSDAKSWQLQPNDIAQVVIDLLSYPDRALPSRVEIRPSRPPKR